VGKAKAGSSRGTMPRGTTRPVWVVDWCASLRCDVYFYMKKEGYYLKVWAERQWSYKILGSWTLLLNECSFSDKWYLGRFLMGLLDDALKGSGSNDKLKATKDKDVEAVAPVLHAFLTEGKDGQGKERRTSTLLVFVDEGAWKACLTERDHELTLWASSDTLWGLLEALEARLTERPVEWRKKKPWTGPGGKKAK
jgi:hypothetical protein